jgi:XapX domain-containing protein
LLLKEKQWCALADLVAGVLVGVIYSPLGMRSPAPPLVALVDFFGMLAPPALK